MSRDQKFWKTYLSEQDTYGSYEDRKPEYQLVAYELSLMGLKHGDSILDVGAGSCDMDRYLRTELGWNGQYIPVDGSIGGTDLDNWVRPNGLTVDYVVCIQTIEHMHRPFRLISELILSADNGMVVTTPNPEVVDVIAVDPTHVSPIWTDELKMWGATVKETEFCGRGNTEHGDTLIGVWDFRENTL